MRSATIKSKPRLNVVGAYKDFQVDYIELVTTYDAPLGLALQRCRAAGLFNSRPVYLVTRHQIDHGDQQMRCAQKQRCLIDSHMTSCSLLAHIAPKWVLRYIEDPVSSETMQCFLSGDNVPRMVDFHRPAALNRLRRKGEGQPRADQEPRPRDRRSEPQDHASTGEARNHPGRGSNRREAQALHPRSARTGRYCVVSGEASE